MNTLTNALALAFRLVMICSFIVVAAQTPKAAKPAAKLPTEDIPSLTTVDPLVDRPIERDDVLDISVVGEKDLSLTYQVSAKGQITPPYLKELQVAGKTPNQVKKELETLWGADVLVNPQVLVTVKSFRKRSVSVLGQVNKESTIELPPDQKIDIVMALAQAGGIKATGNENKIDLSRKGGGKPVRYRLEDLLKTKVYLEPDDVIYVLEKAF